jgi:hypothetical protein
MKIFAMIGAVALGSVPAIASAQAAPDVCPSGNYEVVRHSQLKPGASLAAFGKAVADHAAWYASHGYPKDGFTWGQVVSMDPTTHAPKLEPAEIVTVHTNAADVPKDKHDAGWAAFVAEYSAVSSITSTTVLCMAK